MGSWARSTVAGVLAQYGAIKNSHVLLGKPARARHSQRLGRRFLSSETQNRSPLSLRAAVFEEWTLFAMKRLSAQAASARAVANRRQ